MPQPYFVPVNSSASRKIHKSGVSGAAATVRFFPLTVKDMVFIFSCLALRIIFEPIAGFGDEPHVALAAEHGSQAVADDDVVVG